MCLRMLQRSWDVVKLSVLDQPGTGLMVVERYPVFQALPLNILHPAIITRSGVWSGFSANRDMLYDRLSIG